MYKWVQVRMGLEVGGCTIHNFFWSSKGWGLLGRLGSLTPAAA